MRTITINLTAGVALPIYVGGNYFHLLETTAGIDVEFVRNQGVFATARNMEFGFSSRPSDGFEGLVLTSATTQAVKIVVGEGNGGYDRTTGSVQIIGNQGTFTQTAKSVTNAAQVAAAANTARKSIEVQNNSAAGVLRVRVDGTAASVSSGLRLQPGQSYVPQGYVPTGAISVCMETADATANNVEVIEG
ncbi:MAG: hypothetical protein WCZ98_01410 [Sideroxydans sp.]